MAGRYVLSPRAKLDLEEIWSYTEDHWAFDQAEQYIREIRRHVEITAASPKTGRPCPEVRAGYFRYRVGSQFLFYRIAGDDVVDVVRILYERMDFGRHLPQ
jgi:toxin ParE1/3/4